jgi:hypothetical protein
MHRRPIPLALILWQEEELIHFHAVRCHDHRHDPDIYPSQIDDPEVLRLESLFMKLPLLIFVPTPDLLHVLLECGPLCAVSKLAIVWVGLS